MKKRMKKRMKKDFKRNFRIEQNPHPSHPRRKASQKPLTHLRNPNSRDFKPSFYKQLPPFFPRPLYSPIESHHSQIQKRMIC